MIWTLLLAALAMSAPEVSGQDRELARHHELARQGDGLLQFGLAVRYATGSDVPKDLVLAHMWTNIAAANGSDDLAEIATMAGSLRDLLEFDMTRSEIRRATDLTHVCMGSGYRTCGPGDDP